MEYTKDSPYMAKVVERRLLTGLNSTKKTMHIVLDISGSGIVYAVGDVVGIYPTHDASLVARTLSALKCDGSEMITDPRSQESLRLVDFLTSRANITEVSKKFLQAIAAKQTNGEKREFLERLCTPESREQLKEYLAAHEVWYLLEQNREVEFSPDEFCQLLMPLLPRFYSIASSPKMHPEEIHLTVSAVAYESGGGHARSGVCSHYLCHLADPVQTSVPIYLLTNRGFTLPHDPSVPVIMVGPGTGVAPFRGFVQERAMHPNPGESLLFFGERNRESDFFYRHEWERYVSEGKLQLDLAFSRDQKEKVYVQHRMIERGRQIYDLMERGAHFYVCGDARQMARDVEHALLEIIKTHGEKDDHSAKEYLKALRRDKRYLRDVY